MLNVIIKGGPKSGKTALALLLQDAINKAGLSATLEDDTAEAHRRDRLTRSVEILKAVEIHIVSETVASTPQVS